ncbi:hypothetical protein GLYMA_05G086850v4 [Glycine max]|uniref:uncharacterized protein n=1 Tax=Glycine max TaxID=3847 RepID=UPI0002960A76|nr:uncharacterized protein LOC113001687 [Glycine max]XP_028230975.1 uncharacterized protein LOC114411521 [Glycine soja]KAG4390915.1 hypothetical protein GLYMA_05G086850v4 [Glycine max]KAH1133339.1 hypothetical protein GYH30_011961 [Glycine max]|eukprot:XP_025984376.1 uncharacterized protein LOC113001687 [Glycine max]
MLSICLQSDLPTGQSVKTGIPTQVQSGKAGIQAQLPAGSAPATSELSGSSLTLFQVAYLGNQEVIDNMGKGRNQTGKTMMILQLSEVNHFHEMLSGYDSIRKLEPAVLHKQDQFHMETHFLVIYLAALADKIKLFLGGVCTLKVLP